MEKLKLLLPIFICALTSCTYSFIGSNSEIKYDNSDQYEDGDRSYSSSDITEFNINWISGSIKFVINNDNVYTFKSNDVTKNPDPEKLVLRTWINEGVANIQIGYPGTYNFNNFEKNLEIGLPKKSINTISINTVAGQIESNSFDINTFIINSVSSDCTFKNSNINTLKHYTVSGNLNFVGSLNHMVVNSTGGNVSCENYSNNATVSVNTVSGETNYTFNNGGFVASLNTVSGHFYSNVEYTTNNNKYTYAEPNHNIEVNSTSGGLSVYKK